MNEQDRQERIQDLACIAWQALVQAQPNSNPDALAVRALELAKAFQKVEEANFA